MHGLIYQILKHCPVFLALDGLPWLPWSYPIKDNEGDKYLFFFFLWKRKGNGRYLDPITGHFGVVTIILPRPWLVCACCSWRWNTGQANLKRWSLVRPKVKFGLVCWAWAGVFKPTWTYLGLGYSNSIKWPKLSKTNVWNILLYIVYTLYYGKC